MTRSQGWDSKTRNGDWGVGHGFGLLRKLQNQNTSMMHEAVPIGREGCGKEAYDLDNGWLASLP